MEVRVPLPFIIIIDWVAASVRVNSASRITKPTPSLSSLLIRNTVNIYRLVRRTRCTGRTRPMVPVERPTNTNLRSMIGCFATLNPSISVIGCFWNRLVFKHVVIYIGPTIGTPRNNKFCSRWGSITWQADRKCHLISASSFDKMCTDIKSKCNDMTEDIGPHGSCNVVSNKFTIL